MTLTGTTAAHSPLSAGPKVTRYVGAVRAYRATLSGGGHILEQDAHYLQPRAAFVWVVLNAILTTGRNKGSSGSFHTKLILELSGGGGGLYMTCSPP